MPTRGRSTGGGSDREPIRRCPNPTTSPQHAVAPRDISADQRERQPRCSRPAAHRVPYHHQRRQPQHRINRDHAFAFPSIDRPAPRRIAATHNGGDGTVCQARHIRAATTTSRSWRKGRPTSASSAAGSMRIAEASGSNTRFASNRLLSPIHRQAEHTGEC